ncbi:glucose-6-phosphate isomerase [Paraburkholderia phymatum]|uniref:glucose-6-phosphate isomerase n=1 Tax=Paraburkholderia phymatum TaxID=148447 RepID=UPI00316B9E6E
MSSIGRIGIDNALRIVKVDRSGWMPPTLLWIVTGTLIVTHQGTVLTLAFPVLSIAVGFWLYIRSPVKYVGYVWWLWFLSPEVRRLVDWTNGAYTPTSPIQVAPLAVTMISGLSLIRFYPVLAQRRGLPVLLVLSGLGYAFMVGVLSSGPLAALYDLANWVYPILIGFHILAYSRQYAEYRETIVRTFIGGILVTGIYGLIQFCVMPPWDVFWMRYSQMNSLGDSVPFGVRVFSTMNSSGPFAFAMMGALVYVMAANHRVRWLAGAFGLLSLSLSLVRSAWGGWVIAMLVQLAKSDNKMRMRIAVTAMVLAFFLMPLLMVSPIVERMQVRLQSIVNLHDDRSYAARNDFYEKFARTAFSDLTGEGLGATGTSTKLANDGRLGEYGNFDSGVMNIPFVLGWPGMLLYVSGLMWLLETVS